MDIEDCIRIGRYHKNDGKRPLKIKKSNKADQIRVKNNILLNQLKGYNLITNNLSKRGLCRFAKPNLNTKYVRR